jgi:hypothetical protein
MKKKDEEEEKNRNFSVFFILTLSIIIYELK